MAKDVDQLYWINNLIGINQRQNADDIPENMSYVTKNVSLDKFGVWAKSKGNNILGETIVGRGVYGLEQYRAVDAVQKIHAIKARDLESYMYDTNTWTVIDTGQFGAQVRTESVNYKNRIYWLNSFNNLCYESEGTCTDVGAAGNEISGLAIATAQNTLFVGGVTGIAGSGVDELDRVYYSLFDNTNNVPDDQLYDTGETMATSSRWFTLQARVKALHAFSADNLLYAFSDRATFKFDMRFENNATGLVKIFDIGAANSRAVTEVNGWMVWMDNNARIWAWGGAGLPIDLGWEIDDDTQEESFIANIDRSNLENVCLGSLGNKLYVSIGSLDYFDVHYNNAVLTCVIDQKLNNIRWSIEDWQFAPTIFKTINNQGRDILLWSHESYFEDTDRDVYQTNQGLNHDGTAISSFARTKFTGCGDPMQTKEAKELIIKFRPQRAEDTYLKVSYAIDGKRNYTVLSDPDNSVTKHGVVDMYDADHGLKFDKIAKVAFPSGTNFRTISIGLENNQLDETFEISGIGIRYMARDLDLRYQA